MNITCIVGNLTRDPELKATRGGTSVCTLGVAVNERVKGSDGSYTERANFFDVDTFGSLADNCARYLTRGRQVAVTGRLRYESWETQEGQKRSKVKIVASFVDFIGKPEQSGTPHPDPAHAQAEAAFDSAKAFVSADSDDDIPF